MLCPHCQTQNPPDAHYCHNCGAAFSLRCSNCQAELLSGARFCMFCGQAISQRTPDDDARHTRLAATLPSPLAAKVRASLFAGERRVVTVLFADVVGSTALTEQVDLETYTTIINGAFDRLTPAIYRYEGTIAHTLGDSLVAFFGTPVAHEDDPFRAVRAALDSLEAVKEYADWLGRKQGIDFAMRFCLNTGLVVIGPVESDLRYEYTAMGGAVNLAARLKFATPPMSVIISDHTYRFVAPMFECIDLGMIEVKDREEKLRVYQVISPKAEPGTLRGLAGLESAMVGRDKELFTLMQLCDAVRSGLGRAVLISGEPGLGKTRLIAEWQAAIAHTGRAPAPQWAEGRCLSYGQGTAYQLVIDLLRSLLGVPEAASETEKRSALQSLLVDLFGALENPEAQEIYPFLGHLLSFQLEETALERIMWLDPQALQAQYLAAMRKLIPMLAALRPIVLILEDLHWSDPSSVEIITRLLPLVFSVPVLYCLVTRPERDSQGWKLATSARELLGGSLTELTLEPLSEKDSRQLVANLLDIEALPESLRTLILQKAEGNPFFVEEVVRMLIERNAIVRHGNEWAAGGGIENLEIPDNLQGLLMARIDRLSYESKHTLRVASVVGRQFPVKVLRQVLGVYGDSSDIPAEKTMLTLSNLESAGLIRIAQVEPDLEYLFRHNLVQEAAYASLLVSDRKRLHLVVGETVELMYPDQLSSRELAPRLGQHFSEAGDDQRALKYFALAGQAALASYANREAEIQFRRGLSLARTVRQQAELRADLAEALSRQSSYAEAIRTWQAAIGLYLSLEEYGKAARLYALAARASWWAGDTPMGLSLCQQGLEAVTGAPENPDIAFLVHETARAYHFNGVPAQAKAYCLQALQMAERLGVVDVQADALTTLGILPGQPPEVSLEALSQAVQIAESSGLLIIAARAHLNLGSMKRGFHGDMEAARYHYQRAVDISRQRGVVQEELFTRTTLISISLELGEMAKVTEALPALENMATTLANPRPSQLELIGIKSVVQLYLGSWNEALDILRGSLEESRNLGNLQNLLNLDYDLVMVVLELNSVGEQVDWSEAESAITEALQLSERGLGIIAGPLYLLTIMRTRQGRFDEAATFFQQAQESMPPYSDIWLNIFMLWAETELASAKREWSEAITAYEAAYDILSRIGLRWYWGKLLLNWADTLILRGEPTDLERARGMLREASAIFEQMGASGYLQLIERKRQALREKTFTQALIQGEFVREMDQARRAQKSFLPEEAPILPGWDLAAVLESARETSGDYYDFINLLGGNIGIVVADVADKGAGAALFMASSRTLLRAYAEEFPTEPHKVLEAVNRRLLVDTRAGMFVTLFFGVLDPDSGTLIYCNAGHNPPLLFSPQPNSPVRSLTQTGIPIGIFEDAGWEKELVELVPGDALVLYTDGVTEAQDSRGEYYGDARLLASAQMSLSKQAPQESTAQMIIDNVRADIANFVGDSPRSDDLTLLALIRKFN